jgi:hypothetical protein
MSPPHRRCPRTPRHTTPAGGRVGWSQGGGRRRNWAGHENNRDPVTMRNEWTSQSRGDLSRLASYREPHSSPHSCRPGATPCKALFLSSYGARSHSSQVPVLMETSERQTSSTRRRRMPNRPLRLVLGRHRQGLELGQEPAEDALVDSGAPGGVADPKAIRGRCQCLQHADQAPRGAGGDERLPFRPVGCGAVWSGDQRTHGALTRGGLACWSRYRWESGRTSTAAACPSSSGVGRPQACEQRSQRIGPRPTAAAGWRSCSRPSWCTRGRRWRRR